MIVIFFTKQNIVLQNIDYLAASKVNNKLYINGHWDAFIILSKRLTASDSRYKDGKLIIRLYDRNTLLRTSPYFLVHIPVSQIPDVVYIDDKTGELKALPVEEKEKIKNAPTIITGVFKEE